MRGLSNTSHGCDQTCALRAPTVFFQADGKRIRLENTVLVNTKQGMGVLYKIADCARIRFSSARNRRSARTNRRPRKCRRSSVHATAQLFNNGGRDSRRHV